jgi:hypothetical protein
VARYVDTAYQREFAQDLALSGAGEGVLVVDGGVSRFDHDFAGSEVVERYLLDAAAIAVGVVVDAEGLELCGDAHGMLARGISRWRR